MSNLCERVHIAHTHTHTEYSKGRRHKQKKMDMNTQIRNESAKMNMVKCIALSPFSTDKHQIDARSEGTEYRNGVIENGEERKKENEHFQMPISFL